MDKEQHLRIDLSGALVGYNVIVARLRIMLKQHNASLERVLHLVGEMEHTAKRRYDELLESGIAEDDLINKKAELETFRALLDDKSHAPIPLPGYIEDSGIIASPPIRKEPHMGMLQPDGVFPSYAK